MLTLAAGSYCPPCIVRLYGGCKSDDIFILVYHMAKYTLTREGYVAFVLFVWKPSVVVFLSETC